MRLHHLSATAFGPFATTVEVDFDDLAAGGLFLLTGDTGAGKTSILDAVCFALYGEVPGDRHTARHLRSDQAAPSTAPRVVLELSVRGRRFRFTRSPAWDRPKRRGVGTTRVQAHAVVEEQRVEDDSWVGLTHRLDEAGHLVIDLLGMTCQQFTQVAMLPQGRFQAFLRATSSERHDVLQRLFRTRRFEDVERWLAERRLQLRRDARTHHDATVGVLNRLQEAAGAVVPEDWSMSDLDPVAADGTIEAWATARLDEAAAQVAAERQLLIASTEIVDRATEELERARAVTHLRDRGLAAQRTLTTLERSAAESEQLAASLAAHHRATAVAPLGRQVRAAAERQGESAARARSDIERVGALLGVDAEQLDLETLDQLQRRLTEERAVAEAWLPREQQVVDDQRRLAALAAEVATLTETLATAERRVDEVGTRRSSTVVVLDEATAAARHAEEDRATRELADAALQAAREVSELSAEIAAARHRLSGATTHAQDLRQAYLDLREERISGMAAELAVGLAVGCSCPVCGSTDHPTPATASSTVSREQEDALRESHENADFERQTVQELVATLSARLQGALVRSGGHTLGHWQTRVQAARAAAARSTAAEHEVDRLRTALADLTTEAAHSGTELVATRVQLEERSRAHADLERRHRRLANELEALLVRHPGLASVAALVESHEQALLLVESARASRSEADRAAGELVTVSDAALRAAEEAGFATLAAASDALLPADLAADRAALLDQRRSDAVTATAVLTEEQVVLALAEEPPDVDGIAGLLARERERRDDRHAASEQSLARYDRVAVLVRDLGAALAAWAPVREQHGVAAGLAALVEGTSADNRLKMRLSAYVLSERLCQVVAAANERLESMTDQRFSLEQADARGAGEQRGGLSLRVRDAWSGTGRDPATLSGGETFIVSLALALGLADTVTHEAGGTQLDTLFIDEGFGALDATTLDAVMDTLDTLRDGGRVVGLVSHVSELRNRVPAQLEVSKARQGSSVRTVVVDH